MHRDPVPESSRPASGTVVRLILAALLVGAGAVLMFAGMGSIASRSGSDEPSGAVAVATASAVSTAPGVPGQPSAGSAGTPASPTVSPSATGDPVLVGAGDIARCDGPDDEATADLVDTTPGIVFTLGDNAYEQGSADDFRNCFGPSWGRFLPRIAFPVPGNHDYGTRDAQGYRDAFGAAAVRNGTTWYSSDVGTWHVVVLDSDCEAVPGGCGPASAQAQWLKADLAASAARCTLALWHHPRFSSGYHGNDEAVAPFWDVLYAAGADLVLNGHDHDYERFAPQDPQAGADPERGITEVVAGTGGAELREFRDPVANSVVRSSVSHGIFVVTLAASGWTYRFESTDGMFSDQGGGTCH